MIEIKANGDGYAAVSDYLEKHYFNKYPKRVTFGFRDDWDSSDIYYIGVECASTGFCVTKVGFFTNPRTGEEITMWLDDWWEGDETVKLHCFIPLDAVEYLISNLDNVKPDGIQTTVECPDYTINFVQEVSI